MGILFDKNKLLEVFGSFRMHDEFAGIVEYNMTLKDEFIFSLHISTYDEFAVVTLFRPDRESWLFDVDIRRVSRIIYENEALKFYREENENEPALVVTIKPHISLQCRAAAPEDKS